MLQIRNKSSLLLQAILFIYFGCRFTYYVTFHTQCRDFKFSFSASSAFFVSFLEVHPGEPRFYLWVIVQFRKVSNSDYYWWIINAYSSVPLSVAFGSIWHKPAVSQLFTSVVLHMMIDLLRCQNVLHLMGARICITHLPCFESFPSFENFSLPNAVIAILYCHSSINDTSFLSLSAHKSPHRSLFFELSSRGKCISYCNYSRSSDNWQNKWRLRHMFIIFSVKSASLLK